MKAAFIPPMLLLRTDKLPDDRVLWQYELKLDGYRALAFRTNGELHFRSRNDKDFAARYPQVLNGLAGLPEETVVDGELVAYDDFGRPSFNALQNFGSASARVEFFIFDLLVLEGNDLRNRPLHERQKLLETQVQLKLRLPARCAGPIDASLANLVTAVELMGMEGIVAKRRDSKYQSGQRTGQWLKLRLNRGQEFVIGGYTPGSSANTFHALIFGYCKGTKLVFAARTRNGFTPAARVALMKRFKGLEIARCPFANLPERSPGHWGEGMTREEMAECVWLKPELVGQFEFREWTPDEHLRHSKFVALREGRDATKVTRE